MDIAGQVKGIVNINFFFFLTWLLENVASVIFLRDSAILEADLAANLVSTTYQLLPFSCKVWVTLGLEA